MLISSVRRWFAGLLLLLALAPQAMAQGPTAIAEPEFNPARYAHLRLSPAQLEACRELELAQFRFSLWEQWQAPLAVRDLDRQIRVAQAQVDSIKRQQQELAPFNKWVGGGSAFFLQNENLRVGTVAAQASLEQLVDLRNQAAQEMAAEYQLRKMEVDRARIKLRLTK